MNTKLLVISLAPAAGLQHFIPRCDRRSAFFGIGAATLANVPPASALAAATTPKIPTWRLKGGVAFPTLALNTAGLTADGAELAFRNAVAAGISHVDFHPGIERDGVARVLPSIARESVFLNTKIPTKWEKGTITPSEAAASVPKFLDENLAILGTDYVDMFMLRDSTDPAVMRAMWKEMEKAKADGRARSLGVINYCEGALQIILSTANELPSINYFQLHAGMGPDSGGLRAFGETRGIRTFAYGHLGERANPKGDTDELLASPTLRRIGAAHGGRTAEEIALKWVLQSGAAASVRPTSNFAKGRSACDATSSACADGLRTSAGAFGYKLTKAEMKEIDAMTSPMGYPTLFSSPGCPDSFFSVRS